MKTLFIDQTKIEIFAKNEVTEEIAQCPLDYVYGDEYILVYPFGMDSVLDAYIENDKIYLTIDRDCYEFEGDDFTKLAKIGELFYTTESIDEVRSYLSNDLHELAFELMEHISPNKEMSLCDFILEVEMTATDKNICQYISTLFNN
jgi:hypothetical protein